MFRTFNNLKSLNKHKLKYSRLFSSNLHNTRLTKCGLHIRNDLPKPFNKILIANRGEIAVRIIRTCRELGVKTVGVFSDADSQSLHTKLADESYYIGKSPSTESYLDMNTILEVAKNSKSEAIHPGYGFLSENYEFSRLCTSNNIEFIGPPPEAMIAMGDKSEAKKVMQKANVPVVPGYEDENQDYELFKKECIKIGYPVMLKAVAGGGGKGIRPVFKEEELYKQMQDASNEAFKGFGNGRLLIEKLILNARHIEFQIFADKHNNCIHLYERDCSVQRGNQKIFEESPAPFLPNNIKEEMGKHAVSAALATGYVGAGTVEFLVDPNTFEYYFMEMNTRLQVEHPVTEMIVSKDLVQLQLHVASGNKLPYSQNDIISNGYSIEARICAEDPYNDFQPSSGKLYRLEKPKIIPGEVRVESGFEENDIIPEYYDSMISKLICHSNKSRDDALNKLNDCLENYKISDIKSNIEFLKIALNNKEFRKGGVTTSFIKDNEKDLFVSEDSMKDLNKEDSSVLALGGLIKVLVSQRKNEIRSLDLDSESIWYNSDLLLYSPTNNFSQDIQLQTQNKIGHNVNISFDNIKNNYILKYNSYNFSILKNNLVFNYDKNNLFCIINDGNEMRKMILDYSISNNILTLFYSGKRYDYIIPQYEIKYEVDEQSTLNGIVFSDLEELGSPVKKIKATMSCLLLDIKVKEGELVKQGDTLVTIEAMKKLQDVIAECDGIVSDIQGEINTNLQENTVIMKLTQV